MIDLHTHSTASDGTLTPRELILLARQIDLTAVALCDHDTTSGIADALQTADEVNQFCVPGLELSANWRQTTVHIVGLFIDPASSTLQQVLERTRQMRDARNPKIIAALQGMGIDITMADVQQYARGNTVGRPHIAAVMVAKGVVATPDDAFSKYLGFGGCAYVPKARLQADEAIAAIRGAGGVTVLAHPHQTQLSETALDSFVGELKPLGLQGIEVFYSGYTSGMSATYTRIARKHDLVRSGGSDFHGAAKPGIRLGRGMGNLYVRDDLLDPIRALAGCNR